MALDKRIIVISAINFTEGGPLSILKDSLSYSSKNLTKKYDIFALVHDKTLFNIPNINYIEFPKSKKSWIYRLFYEWIYFKKLSKILKPYLWFSLHDITPRVAADIQAVYCHNPAPFYRIELSELFIDFRFALFNLFYSILYRLNIKKNDWIIVQQNWIRNEFLSRFPVKNVVVGYPEIRVEIKTTHEKTAVKENKKIFFFPTYPRLFKNIELICSADKLVKKEYDSEYEIWITISGNENKYARKVRKKCTGRNIKFIGPQNRESIFELYQNVDCLIFPSKLETWGMPLSEFKLFKKPMLVANLPYAHETVGDYQYVKYFDVKNAYQLADYMELVIHEKLDFDKLEVIKPSYPFAENWSQLFDIILAQNN